MSTFQGYYVYYMKLSVFEILLFQMKYTQSSLVMRNRSFLKLPYAKGKCFLWIKRLS